MLTMENKILKNTIYNSIKIMKYLVIILTKFIKDPDTETKKYS